MPTPAPPAPKGVPAFNPEGELVSIPALDQSALMQGYRAASPEDVAAAQREAKYGSLGQEIATGAEAAGSALTFGLSPKIETALGITTPEDIRGRAEENPVAHGLGTAAGVVAPLVLTAGAAAPLEGAEAASAGAEGLSALRGAAEFTAPALIAKAGRGASALAEGAGLPGALGSIAPTLAGAAVEGGLYAGQDVTEKALLGDPQMTWEKAASEVGLGALFGGALGVGTEGAAKGLGWMMNKAVSGLESVGARLAGGDQEVARIIFKGDTKGTISELEKAAPGILDSITQNSTKEQAQFILKHADRIIKMENEFPGIAELMARASPDTADRILNEWGNVIKDPQARNELVASMADSVNNAYSSVEGALREVNRAVRPNETEFLLNPEMERLTGGISHQEAQAEAARLTVKMSKLIDTMRAEPELYKSSAARELELIKEGLKREGDAQANPFDLYKLINRSKQLIGNQAQFGSEIAPEWQRSITATRDLYSEFRKSLENSDVWGPVAERQREFNAAQTAYLNARKIITKGPAFQKLMQKRFLPNGQVAFEANPRSINSWLNLMADPRGGAKSSDFANYLQASSKLADEMEKSGYAGAPDIKALIGRTIEQTREAQAKGAITQVIKQLQGHEIMSSGPAVPDSSAMLMKAARWIPGGVGHAVGLAHELHGTVTKLSQPSMTVGALSALKKLAEKSSKRLNAAANGIFETGAAGAAGAAASERFARGGMVGEDFERNAASLRDFSSNLDRLSDTVSKETDVLSRHAPATADAARGFAARVVSHLASKLPQEPQRQLLDPPASVPPREIKDFHRRVDVADRGPTAVLEHLANGTLHPDHVETSQALFPKLHAQAQQLVMEKLSNQLRKGEHIPHRLRDGLGMLLGSDLEHSHTGASILATQQLYQSPAAQDDAGANAPTGKARQVKTDFSNLAATESERVLTSMRKG